MASPQRDFVHACGARQRSARVWPAPIVSPGMFTASFRLPLLAAIPVFLALTACTPASQDQAEGDTATPSATPTAAPSTHRIASSVTRWRCGDLAVATHFDDDSLESITLETTDRELTLKSMANEDGARFADAAGNEFW